MASQFSFIPRKVAKASKTSATKESSDAGRHIPAIVTATRTVPGSLPKPSLSLSNAKGKAKDEGEPRPKPVVRAKYTDSDYANLICIALSDYALWSDSDLRRKIDLGSQIIEDRGFIPLSYLLRHSRVLRGLHLEDSQTLIVKALREHALDLVEFRLRVSQPSSSAWLGGGSAEPHGGYEIRRKSGDSAAEQPSSLYSKTKWEERTLYMENIPAQYRSIPSIIRFTLALLVKDSNSRHLLARIQNVTLPPHHQDKSGDLPTCKGFALVTFADQDDMEYLLNNWSWDRQPDLEMMEEGMNGSEEASEASKFGFRTVSKARWSLLKEEYLTYRQRLVEEINASQDTESAPPPYLPPAAVPKRARPNEQEYVQSSVPVPAAAAAEPGPEAGAPGIDYSSPYPFSCLVFVKNIHPETNKTTLRNLFAKALKHALQSEKQAGNGLDYIDFSKGMDTCYMRLSTPRHAELLVQSFSQDSISQLSGLDDIGSPASSATKAIAVKLVLGLREQLYWEKVPEKVRRQAVEKAITLQSSGEGIAEGIADGGDEKDGKEDRGKRKRRKKNGGTE